MIDEFNAQISNDTWMLAPHHSYQNLVADKRVYKIKYKSNNTVKHCKARLGTTGHH